MPLFSRSRSKSEQASAPATTTTVVEANGRRDKATAADAEGHDEKCTPKGTETGTVTPSTMAASSADEAAGIDAGYPNCTCLPVNPPNQKYHSFAGVAVRVHSPVETEE